MEKKYKVLSIIGLTAIAGYLLLRKKPKTTATVLQSNGAVTTAPTTTTVSTVPTLQAPTTIQSVVNSISQIFTGSANVNSGSGSNSIGTNIFWSNTGLSTPVKSPGQLAAEKRAEIIAANKAAARAAAIRNNQQNAQNQQNLAILLDGGGGGNPLQTWHPINATSTYTGGSYRSAIGTKRYW